MVQYVSYSLCEIMSFRKERSSEFTHAGSDFIPSTQPRQWNQAGAPITRDHDFDIKGNSLSQRKRLTQIKEHRGILPQFI